MGVGMHQRRKGDGRSQTWGLTVCSLKCGEYGLSSVLLDVSIIAHKSPLKSVKVSPIRCYKTEKNEFLIHTTTWAKPTDRVEDGHAHTGGFRQRDTEGPDRQNQPATGSQKGPRGVVTGRGPRELSRVLAICVSLGMATRVVCM